MRAKMNADANAVNPVHTAQSRAANNSAMNAVIAPNPTLASASPTPGTDTAATTLMNDGRALAVGTTRWSGVTTRSVRSGTSVVASAIATKPKAPYSTVPAGAPSANAAYIAVPIQAMTLPVFRGPPSTNPQACAPVMMKLS